MANEARKERRAAWKPKIQKAIKAAGDKGCTAMELAVIVGAELPEGDDDKAKATRKEQMQDVRFVARLVCKEQKWSRAERRGREKVYTCNPVTDEEVAAAAERKANRKAKAKAKAADDDDNEDDDAGAADDGEDDEDDDSDLD